MTLPTKPVAPVRKMHFPRRVSTIECRAAAAAAAAEEEAEADEVKTEEMCGSEAEAEDEDESALMLGDGMQEGMGDESEEAAPTRAAAAESEV